MDDEVLQELLQHSARGVSVEGDHTVIVLDDGRRLVVNGRPQAVHPASGEALPRCAFCGAPPDEDPLFSVENDVFICKRCTALAVRTFLENGVRLPLNIPLKELVIDDA